MERAKQPHHKTLLLGNDDPMRAYLLDVVAERERKWGLLWGYGLVTITT
jgi:hypothetical protein